MKNALNNQVGMHGDMFLWLVANLKQGVIYFIKQALPPNKSAGSVLDISRPSDFSHRYSNFNFKNYMNWSVFKCTYQKVSAY